MKLKQLLAVLLIAVTLLALAACGTKEPEYANALERVKGTGKLIMATNPEWAPFEFENLNATADEEKYLGCDIALGRYIAEQLGVELVLDPMSFETVIEAVVQGRADIGISAFAYKESRAQSAMLAGPYALGSGYQGALIRKGMEGEIKTVEDLNNRSIAVQISSVQQEYADKYLTGCTYTEISSPIDGVLALQNGTVDALLIASTVGEGFMENNDDLAMSELRFPNTEGCYAIIQLEQQELFDEVQAIITEAESSGKFAEWRAEAERQQKELNITND